MADILRGPLRTLGALMLVAVSGGAQPAPPPTITFSPYLFKASTGDTIPAELGAITVPERRANPSSRRITLRFVRFRSTSATPGAPIIYLAGGPGGSGIRTAAGPRFPLFMALRELGDVIALDQRGVGQSATMAPCKARTEPSQPLTRAALASFTRDG